MSFAGACLKLEAIILSKLTQEEKIHTVCSQLYKWELNDENMCTHRGDQHTLGSIGGHRGGMAWGEMPNVGEGEEGSKTHCHVCTYATILHVLHMYPKT